MKAVINRPLMKSPIPTTIGVYFLNRRFLLNFPIFSSLYLSPKKMLGIAPITNTTTLITKRIGGTISVSGGIANCSKAFSTPRNFNRAKYARKESRYQSDHHFTEVVYIAQRVNQRLTLRKFVIV